MIAFNPISLSLGWRSRALLLGAAMLLINGCGSGSGASTSANPSTAPPSFSNYTGPAPQTEDVQRFRIHVWDNLVANNRCGSCHIDGNPRFVRTDDVNLAYAVATQLVDLSDPGSSLLVQQVRNGHHCWLTSNQACGDIIETYISNWAGEGSGSGTEIQLTAPPLRDPGASLAFPAFAPAEFGPVHDLLTEYCSGCHVPAASPAIAPFFAVADVQASYLASLQRINLDNPEQSRYVARLGAEFHNCWDNCADNAAEMEAAIAAMAAALTPTDIDPDLVTSRALSLVDGIVASIGGRHDGNVIALYEFKEGTGSQAFDTSGVEPALNLSFQGSMPESERWVGGWGINIATNDRWSGGTVSSRKLHDLIRATGEYSVEIWVAPGNVTQDGPAPIVSYAGGLDTRNFMLAQTLYNYDFLHRSSTTDNGGGVPALSTPDGDDVLQATLQHVVVTFDPANGRRIYVNGELVDVMDPVAGGLLNNWENNYALVLGDAPGGAGDVGWAGQIRLLAIHNRALNAQQILENFEVGVGQKFFLLFNISNHIGIEDAYVVFEVSQFDSYSYLFNAPFFVVLDAEDPIGNIPLQGMRIGINGREAAVGQAYVNLDLLLNDADYADEGRQWLSRLGTVIGLENGPMLDEFFLTFEQLGASSHVRLEPVLPTPAAPEDCTGAACPSHVGVRTFDAINATMSALTGVPKTNGRVMATFGNVRQQLPAVPDMEAFLASHQMGITQLAIEYCSVLVDNQGDISRTEYFPDVNFGAAPATALNAAGRDALVDTLMLRMVGNVIPNQPEDAQVRGYVNQLLDELVDNCASSCATAARTQIMVKAACAAVLGSAPLLLQ